ncbi:type IV toxin-antitoxin system AbiEi family antitoxin domain-containing protein [Nocardioides sp. HDW12B]|uniref:type IV toxin-antitoxin system AbiEi family antitoxin domain-containing protein n=1 Tax=Nocardioides sp. HDW12B TaxID=2714939 RepID=UPI00140D18C8|nr:type IV toxin-antitoxin system AbiEi family antitoxin domain-containing protein [Nocardioides sp. HDW12B]QIK67946.1 type IV toxin-antitoxin system AbiEi family antitoxin domain-containing protein [Nocardioides sp. HDW12B]
MTTTRTVVYDDLLRRLALEHGAFLRREVLELGLDDRDLRRHLRAGVWVRVRHGAYTFRDLWDVMGLEERHRVRARAAMRVLGQRVVVSHHSACLMHRLPVWGADLERVQLTRRDGAQVARKAICNTARASSSPRTSARSMASP